MNDNKLIEARNISKSFGKVKAINKVCFSVDYGEVVGLVGGNGAGKSTLIKILSGYMAPDEGEIYMDGSKVSFKSTIESRLKGIETVYQEEALADDLSIERNLFLGREPTKLFGPLRFLDTKKMEKDSNELMDTLSLRVGSTKQEVKFCSGGERQGVAIARAIYFKSKLVILDEPTRALAIAGINRVLNFIKELKNRNIACIFISHELFHAYNIMDRIVIMIRGNIIKDVPKSQTTFEETIKTLSSDVE